MIRLQYDDYGKIALYQGLRVISVKILTLCYVVNDLLLIILLC